MPEAKEAPTRKKIEQWRERRMDLEDRVSELGGRVQRLTAELAEAHADGAPDDRIEGLTEERREAEEMRRDVEAALPVLAERIEAGREEAARERARERIGAIKKKVGGLRGEQPRHLDRAREYRKKYLDAMEKATAAWPHAAHLEAEAKALAGRFDVEAPALELPERVAKGHEPQGVAWKTTWRPYPGRPATGTRNKPPAERLRLLAGALTRQFGEDTPAPDLIEWAGEKAPGDDLTWEEKRRAANERRKAEQAREREEKEQAVDTFVHETLADGPVQKDKFEEEYRAADLPTGPHAKLSDSKRRVGVRVAIHRETNAAFYVLSKEHDLSEYKPPGGGRYRWR